MGEHGPNDASTVETVLPAVLGFAVAGFIIATAFYVCRLRQRSHKKSHEPAIYHPKKRTTAVRSPSGQPGGPPHYLKKSPSPTSVNKPLPGSLSPTTETSGGQINHGSSSNLKAQAIIAHPKYTEESEIQTKIIGQMENSTSSIGSDGNDTQEYGKLGSLVFKLRYLTDRSALVVSVIRCRGLPYKNISDDLPNGINGKTQTATDPYVKLQLLPDKQHKVKTRVVRNTRNPVYDEDFTFYGLSMVEISAMSLHFVVLSFDRYSRDDVIGEVILPLNEIDLNQIETQQVAMCKEIQPRSLKIRAQGRGELLVSLCWQPGAARLTVVLLKARNLPRMDVTGLADPYVKIYLLCNGQRIAKKKTHVKKRTLSPVFNESFAFDIPTNEGTGSSLENISLELMLLDWDRVTKNEVIGRLELGGPRCAGAAQNHWNEVCNSPRRQIAEWHKMHE
ncbi:synaptotagmin-4 isoform X2 [Sitodiplosis mosellana]|uniref:synaptotagmin-4 isoform X2 n=1 Tax=Sitodiplosis mosellana TaxID=263140 RepID=UPI00244403C6|nr:synaptotagmin-4 isoform X2 [Sitodiplosis mosellana]